MLVLKSEKSGSKKGVTKRDKLIRKKHLRINRKCMNSMVRDDIALIL